MNSNSITAVVTIVSNNYLHFARTLMQSVAEHVAAADRFCVVVDRDPAPAAQMAHDFEVVALDKLNLPDGEGFFFQYSVLELNTAVKPWAMQYLLERGYEKVIYIDPDILLYGPLREVLGLLDSGASIVLTPHLLAPIDDGARPTELDIRRAGTYNLGFCAVKKSPIALNMLSWWQTKLERDCVVDFERGVFVDQSWMDLVPGMFDGVEILRHPGYNVAYWNLAERLVQGDETDAVTVNGAPLVFFHFSGLDPAKPERLSKHQDRYTLSALAPSIRGLVEQYAQRVIANGLEEFRVLPYGFAQYVSGQPILDSHRVAYRTSPQLRQACLGRPFHAPEVFANAGEGGYLDQLPAEARQRLMALYRALLGRLPDEVGASSARSGLQTRSGMAKLVLAVGLSSEARRTPGWAARLLRFIASVESTPPSIKRRVVRPLVRMLEVGSRLVPSLAYRPAQSDAIGARLNAPPLVSRAVTAAHGVTPPIGLNLVGYLKAELGVGEAARSLARACHAAGIPFSAIDVGYQSQNLQRDDSVLSLAQPSQFDVDLLYVNADQTLATVDHLAARGVAMAPYVIGFWHWEQPELPAHHASAFAPLDEIWVPSTFVQEAVTQISPLPVYRVPHAISPTLTPGVGRANFGLPQDRLLVLVMYDFHSYQFRKNPQAAIAAYRLAYEKRPELGLVLKTINGHHHPEALAGLRIQVADLPHVYLIDEFLTRQQTWDLQNECDILLSLHRAEGFGLAPAEMMSMGKVVVATGWSGNMDFMTSNNSMPVRYALQPLEQDVGAYPAGPVWAEANVDHAAQCLVQLAQDADLRTRLGQSAARTVAEELSPGAVGLRVLRRLQALVCCSVNSL